MVLIKLLNVVFLLDACVFYRDKVGILVKNYIAP